MTTKKEIARIEGKAKEDINSLSYDELQVLFPRHRPTEFSGSNDYVLSQYALYRKKDEMRDIQKIIDYVANDTSEESPTADEHEDYRAPLSVDEKRVFDICLSTGGDADGFKLTFNKEGELLSGVYYWADWGVYKEESLSDDEADTVQEYYYVYPDEY